MSKHRVDQVNDLMDRVRAHWDEIDESSDGFERAPAARNAAKRNAHAALHGPAHRTVDVEEAFTRNLIASQFTQPEAFGRKPTHRSVVKSSGSGPTGQRL